MQHIFVSDHALSKPSRHTVLSKRARVTDITTYNIVLDVRILDNLRAEFRPVEMTLSRRVSEVVRAFLGPV